MGTQFWWFYDVIAAAVILICVYISGRKGFLKSAFSAIVCIAALIASMGASSASAQPLYENTIRSGNVKKLEKSWDRDTFTQKYAAYLESMGYSIKVSGEKLDKIFDGGENYDEALCKYVNNVNARKVEKDEAVLREKIREGYAVVTADMIAEPLNKFAAETAAEKIRGGMSMEEFIPLLRDAEGVHKAAVYAADNFTAEAYCTQFRLIVFIVMYIAVVLIGLAMINSFTRNREDGVQGAGSHAAGGFIGLAMGAVMVFAAAAAVRLWTIMGSNEMLFFNNEAIDKTIIFKYFYDFTLNM